MFTNTDCRTPPTAACTIPSSNKVFKLAGTGASTKVTLVDPTAYLASSSVAVTCTFPKDGTAVAAPVTATIIAVQQCTPVAWTYDQVVGVSSFKLTSQYSSSVKNATIAPTFENFFNMGTASKTCNGGKPLSPPTCQLLTPRGFTSSAIISYATTSATTKDDSNIAVTAGQNVAGYNTTYAL